MWFNSTQREEPYQPYMYWNARRDVGSRKASTQVLHGCRQLVS